MICCGAAREALEISLLQVLHFKQSESMNIMWKLLFINAD